MSDIKATTGSVMIANGDMIPIERIGNLKLFEKDSHALVHIQSDISEEDYC